MMFRQWLFLGRVNRRLRYSPLLASPAIHHWRTVVAAAAETIRAGVFTCTLLLAL